MFLRRAVLAMVVALHGLVPGLHIATFRPANRAPSAIEHDLLVRLNDERATRHLAPLTVDVSLAASARRWSVQMSKTNMHHSDLTLLFQGHFDEVGENIAWASGNGATSGLIHGMWMRSDHHRENILAAAYTSIGIGVYCAPDGKLWATQQFGRAISAGPPMALSVPPTNPIVHPDSGGSSC